MGDADRGAAFHQLLKGGLNHPFRFRIKGARRLVQHQNGGIFENGPGNGNPLTLTHRQGNPFLPHHGLVSLGLLLNEILGVGMLRRRLDLLQRGPGPSQFDVGPDRLVEQHRLLRNQRNLIPQIPQFHIAQINPADPHRAAGRIIKPEQQGCQGRLAGAAASHKSHKLAWPYIQVDSAQDRLLPVIELNPIELDRRVGGMQPDRRRRILHRGRGVQQFKGPLARRPRLLQLVLQTAQAFDRLIHHEHPGNKLDQIPGTRLHRTVKNNV